MRAGVMGTPYGALSVDRGLFGSEFDRRDMVDQAQLIPGRMTASSW
jgi:hypothetical protein